MAEVNYSDIVDEMALQRNEALDRVAQLGAYAKVLEKENAKLREQVAKLEEAEKNSASKSETPTEIPAVPEQTPVE